MKNGLALFVLAGTTLLCRLATAQDKGPAAAAEAAKAPEPAKGPSLELYVTAVPFIELVDLTGPTQLGYVPPPGHVGTAQVAYTGTNGPWRFRMTSGTSHFGFRASAPLAEQLKIVAQIETAMPLDGDVNLWEQYIPNRQSYLGLSGDWGTLAFGLLDTPYKWITLTTVNPVRAGYVADYTPIIGTPGFRVTAVNPAQSWNGGSGISNMSFDRREGNTVQYWSPSVAGFYLRASYTLNEYRAAAVADASGNPDRPETNAYIVSLGGGFDYEGLRLRYAWENHHDYFALAYLEFQEVPDLAIPSSNDWGNKALAQYTLSISPALSTRFVALGEYLIYTLDLSPAYPDIVAGDINRYERPAVYGMIEQRIGEHHVWGAYGRAFPGKCERMPNLDGTPAPCSTANLGAQYVMAGYMYAFSDKVQGFLMGYRLMNEPSALYVTTPPLPALHLSPGFDQTGVGVGLYYAFGADLLD